MRKQLRTQISVALLLIAAARCLAQDSSGTFDWDAVTSRGLAGYRLYFGTASRTYSSMINMGNGTQFTVPDLTNGVTYYFALTAYNMRGVESGFSQEVSYTPSSFRPPPAGVTLTLTMMNQRTPVIQGQGIQAHVYHLEGTTNFTTWTAVGDVTSDSLGHFSFADSSAAAMPARFYRARDTTSATQVTLSVITIPGQSPLIQGNGVPNHIYEVRATSDFSTWEIVGIAVATATGQFSVTDSNGGALGGRYYSATDITP